jgi:hypothetical protein
MRHFALPRFWRYYRQLPEDVQALADKNFELLKRDDRHPSLHFKKVETGGQVLWSVRVGIGYRAPGLEKPDGIVWFWVGTYAEYDKMLS